MSIPAWATKLPWNILSEASEHRKVPLPLLAAIAQQESGGRAWVCRYEPAWATFLTPDVFAKSIGISLDTEKIQQATSWGLFQVMGTVLRELGFMDSLAKSCKPHLNADYGALKLSKLLKKYADQRDAIAAYNAGSPRRGSSGLYVNQKYVDDVQGFMSQL